MAWETVTVAFAEIDSPAELLERFGEERFLALSAEYEVLLDRHVTEHGGTREARLLAFRSARAGVHCAVALQRAMAGSALPFRVRVGLHSGELERSDGELRGRALVKAARIAALAGGGRDPRLVAHTRARGPRRGPTATCGSTTSRESELRGLRGTHVVVPVRWRVRAAGGRCAS